MYYLIYKMGAVLEYINIYTIYSQISLIYIIWGLEFSYNSPGSSQKWVLFFFFSGCIHWSAGAHEKMIRGQIGWIYTVICGHLLVITGYSWDYTFY